MKQGGLSAQGWLLFKDLREAQVIGAQPPLTDSWIFVWLAREHCTDLGLGRFGMLGIDTLPRTVVSSMNSVWKPPGGILSKLRSHCCLCGKLIVSHDALRRHVNLRHPEMAQILKVDLFLQQHKEVSNLPCTGCEACSILSARPLKIFHLCRVELNIRLGLEGNRLQRQSAGSFFQSGRSMAEEREGLADLHRM